MTNDKIDRGIAVARNINNYRPDARVDDIIKVLEAMRTEECEHISGGLGACPKCGTPYKNIKPDPIIKFVRKWNEGIPLNRYGIYLDEMQEAVNEHAKSKGE